jgi:hypothetical protein
MKFEARFRISELSASADKPASALCRRLLGEGRDDPRRIEIVPEPVAAITQQPRQILSLRSTAASSALRRSRSPAFSDGMSRVCGCRWPTGASPINREVFVGDEGMDAATDPVDDPARPMVCAIVARLPSRTSKANTLVKFRMLDLLRLARIFLAGAGAREVAGSRRFRSRVGLV